jgi:hypothetical protein
MTGLTGGSGNWQGAWANSGDISILTSSGPAEGSRHVRLRRNTGYLQRAVNVAGATSLQLSFRSKVHSFDGSDRADVRVSTYGVNFTTVWSFTSANSDNLYHYYPLDLTSFLSGGASQVYVAFDAGMSATDDNWYLDDIRLTGMPGNAPPVSVAGPDQTVTDSDGSGSELLTLDGSGSFDPDGTIIAWEWSQGGNFLGDTPALEVDVPVGVWIFTLTTTDNEGATSSDTVQLAVNPPPAEVFADSFDDGTLGPWTQDSQNDWFVSNDPVFDGAFSAEVDGSASDSQLTSPLISLEGRTAASITFTWRISSSLDSNEYLACDLSTNGGSSWSEVGRLRGNVDAEDAWHAATLNVPSAPAGTVRLRFRGKMSSSNEYANVDGVTVVAQ